MLLDTVINDVSERAFHLEGTGQWTKGKSADIFGPIGPWLVTVDEIADPQNLNLWLEKDGHCFQTGNTRTMVFGVAHLISYLSQYMSLHPGNIISTGTRKREWWTGLTRKIRQSGVAFTINIVVHRKNIEHLEEMIASSAHTRIRIADSRLFREARTPPRLLNAAALCTTGTRSIWSRRSGKRSAQITEGEAAAREQRGLYSCPSCSFAKGAGAPYLLELLQVLIIDFHCF
jgi:hypothetical protein